MLRSTICALLLLVATLHGCRACNLTEVVYEESNGLLHRCLNITGTNQWHFNVACWLYDTTGNLVELNVGETYQNPDGRTVAECRRPSYRTALVYHVCLYSASENASVPLRWPGEVWSNDEGVQLTCTNASSSRSYFDQGSRIILYGCNSTQNNTLLPPGSTELQSDNIVRKCVFSGTERRDPEYTMDPVGCWIQDNNEPEKLLRVGFNEEFYTKVGDNRTLLATCRQQYYKAILLFHQCRESTTTGEVLHHVGSKWKGADGVPRECLASDPRDLVNAKIIERACNRSAKLLSPGSEVRESDGSVWRCVFNRYRAAYGWFQATGCWLQEPHWSRFSHSSPKLEIDEEFCPGSNGRCLAKCLKRQYREEVSLVAMVCFDSVGRGVDYRIPYSNWTDDLGIERTCLPMAEQRYKFGVGATTIVRGCPDKLGNGTVAPGTLYYSDDFLVYQCALNRYRRKYTFDEIVGCWMHDSNGDRVTIPNGESFKFSGSKEVATCRKKRYSNDVKFTLEICFKNDQSTPLNWDNSTIAFPNENMTSGSTTMVCNPAATYSDGVHAKWIIYGCAMDSGIQVPGDQRLTDDGIVRECAHNGREGSSAAYAWVKPVGCWFTDHLNQTVVIKQFNVVYNHSAVNGRTAICSKSRYSDPSLTMFVCFSTANERLYSQGDMWTDASTGFDKQCIAKSRYTYSNEGVQDIDAGCWVQIAKKSNNGSTASETQSSLLKNGSLAYGPNNQVLRCDFSDYNRKYEWGSSVDCWYNEEDTGEKAVLSLGKEMWVDGMLVYKCHSTRQGAKLVQHACRHNDTWHAELSTWRDAHYQYKCEPSSGDRSAKVEKTHCITDDGTSIDSSQAVGGVQYVCMHICGFLVYFRDPTPEQYRLLFSFINNCHSVSMSIINSIG